MYILKLILISLHTAVFYIKILLKYYSVWESIYVAICCQWCLPKTAISETGYLKKLGINCISRKFCAQNTVWLFDEIHIIYSKKYADICKIDPKRHRWIDKNRHKNTVAPKNWSKKAAHHPGTSTLFPIPVQSSVEKTVSWFSYEQKFRDAA